MAAPSDRSNPPEAGAESLRRETVLVVEDDPGVARLENRALSRAGYAVVLAESAEVARQTVRGGGVDLMVLDQNLPHGESGLGLYEELRAEGFDLPAILVTGLSDEATLIRAIRTGLRDFVPKTPDFFDDLIQAVERVFKQSRTERRLAEFESRLAGVTLLAESIPQIVWTADESGRCDFINNRWVAFSGLSPAQAMGKGWTQSIYAEDLERVAEDWATAVAAGTEFQCEFRLTDPSGEPRWFLVRAELVQVDARNARKWFGTCTDIEDQKRHEAELKRANQLAETASRAKDQFLAMLSHELRTPLTPVLLTASAARDDPETPDHLRPTFEVIRQNLELEARLIDDLLDVMRIIRGKMPYHFETVDAHAQIRRAVEICRAEADSKNLRILLELEATDHHIIADSARWQQVLWNLIKNAVKFTFEGGWLRVRSSNQGGRIVVEFTDSGVGIDAAHLPHIFNAFEQGEMETTQRFGGLGLGLAITRSIVEGHGGKITATSPGRHQGTTFTVELATSSVAPARPVENQPALVSPTPQVRPIDRRILLVEDDVMTSRIMAKLLRQNGYVVTTANSFAAALAVPTSDYELIVSDIGLPDGTGLDLIREILPRHDVPSIALTGYGMEDDIRRSQDAGFVAHLTKPLDFAKLDAMIRKVAAEAG